MPAKLFCRAGGTQRLPRLVGRSVAKELIFTGLKICGRDAVSMGMFSPELLLFSPLSVLTVQQRFIDAGLVNYCVPSGEAHSKALAIAQIINQKVHLLSPEALDTRGPCLCHL